MIIGQVRSGGRRRDCARSTFKRHRARVRRWLDFGVGLRRGRDLGAERSALAPSRTAACRRRSPCPGRRRMDGDLALGASPTFGLRRPFLTTGIPSDRMPLMIPAGICWVLIPRMKVLRHDEHDQVIVNWRVSIPLCHRGDARRRHSAVRGCVASADRRGLRRRGIKRR